ncbi:hypothetical protein [Prevotella sp. HUN102]|uniref:hypothetical protein n=1 Tax=Prevotella sp. HUN102 TaxID=1392486 RepID=UPI0012DE9EB8|nr:hypothetical protein [Prevotella sp. HUN102]
MDKKTSGQEDKWTRRQVDEKTSGREDKWTRKQVNGFARKRKSILMFRRIVEKDNLTEGFIGFLL